LVAVNPGSEHFGVVRVNGITSAVMTFPSSGARGGGGGGGRFGGGEQQLISRPAGADPHSYGWILVKSNGRWKRTAAMHLLFPASRAGRACGPSDSG